MAQKKSKFPLRVVVVLMSGERIEGTMFLGYEERVVDTLNDARAFIPLVVDGQPVLVLNKASIRYVELIEEAKAQTTQSAPSWLDP